MRAYSCKQPALVTTTFSDSRGGRLRWLEIVSSTYNVIGRYNHTLSLDSTTMVSKNCPTIGEHVVTIFVTL